ncbi:DUF4129 domain-containing protein [Nocardioides panacisoli]|uniref:DUF4129 domain-containing protein n=1 Tax=Nocardioides panacisoli TaxID=627624 RepID=UPI001C635499|nr:DUF4129 domain-containing protein [Nocardioides panacisoli]QYJ04060.1 DUF4129 domain-containing protein [Nocardioides panacisoli]
MRALLRVTEPPLDPDGDRGRSLLRDELADPQYYSDDLIERALTWISRWLDGLVDTATRADGLSAFLAIVVALALLTALLLLAGRARRTTRLERADRAALPRERVSAAELRDRAEAALAEQRHDDALVDGFRALAVRQIEHGRIADVPQATAHELAHELAGRFPDHGPAIAALADTFDAVLYGDHTATGGRARDALALDDLLAGVRR